MGTMEVTSYTAIYAAIVATSALVWNIWREQRKVKVKLEFNWQPFSPDGETTDGMNFEIVQIGFTVVNDSRYPAYIESVGVVSSDGKEYVYDHSMFVVDRCVQPGMNQTYWMRGEDYEKNRKGKSIKFGC